MLLDNSHRLPPSPDVLRCVFGVSGRPGDWTRTKISSRLLDQKINFPRIFWSLTNGGERNAFLVLLGRGSPTPCHPQGRLVANCCGR